MKSVANMRRVQPSLRVWSSIKENGFCIMAQPIPLLAWRFPNEDFIFIAIRTKFKGVSISGIV